MNRVLTILTLVIVVNLACQSPTTLGLTTADEAALRQVLDIEMSAANAADARKWASIYTQDAIVLRPHDREIQGREAIQQWLSTLPPISSAKGLGAEAFGYGDLAYLRGTYSTAFTITGAPAPFNEQGKFVQIYRKQSDGSWKIAREIYNSDLPLPVPAPAVPPPSAERR